MPEGPIGGPRPFAESPIEISVHVGRAEGDSFALSIQRLEQELREIIRKDDIADVRPDVVAGSTYQETIDTGETVEKVTGFIVKLHTDEMRVGTMKHIIDTIYENYDIDESESRVM
jgi:hypothetical protein